MEKIIRQYIRKLLNEEYFSDRDTFWAWVSPDNKLFRVPKLKHAPFITSKYPELSYDTDRAFDQAFKDGWIRVIYEYQPDRFKGELSLNGDSEDRVKSVLKDVFYDLIRFGYKNVYIDTEFPKKSLAFSTFSTEGKLKLMDYLS